MSTAPVPNASTVLFEGTNPILRVADVDAAVDYYVRVLGFKKDWGDSIFACVSRGKCRLFLAGGDQGHPGSWVYIGVSDTDALLQEYRVSGAKVRHLPTNYRWAYEMQIEDLDGNVLRFGSESKDGPIGEWLDGEGRRWLPQANGGWKLAE